MKIAYLILAHNAPAQLARLIKAITTPAVGIFVHVDAKSDIKDFENIKSPALHFLADRNAVYWGDFSQVDAILALMRVALASSDGYTRFVLLSGTDYPIRSAAYMESFFAADEKAEYINIADMPDASVGKPISRVNDFWPRRSNWFWSRVEAKLRLHAVRIGLLKSQRDHRKYLGNMKPCGGSTWWALTRPACEYILHYVQANPAFVRFYGNTVYPDELMVHTILGNSPFRPSVQRNLTYTDWSKGGSNPAPINAQHVAGFAAVQKFMANGPNGSTTELLFARKFGQDSEALIDDLDRLCAGKDVSSKLEQCSKQ